MIDDYKIKKASRMYADEVFESRKYDENHLQPHHIAFIEGNAAGFEAGAKWAINEFLKDLWHPASEVPDKDRIYSHILYEIDGGYDLNGFNTKMIPIGENWTSFVENEHINRWLYIDDLFPKEGDKQ